MMKKYPIVILSCLLLLVATICGAGQEPAPTNQNGSQPNLKDKKVTIKAEHEALGQIFRQLIYRYNIPIGFEESVLDKDHDDYLFETSLPVGLESRDANSQGAGQARVVPKGSFEPKDKRLTLDFQNERLEVVLDTIVGQMENYEWKINDGVVNIFPTRGRDKRFEELLNVEIREFAYGERDNLNLLRTEIFFIPEIAKFLKTNNLYRVQLSDMYAETKAKLPGDLRFSNVKFRDMLNRIAKTKPGGWIIKSNKHRKLDGNEYIEIII